MGRIPTMIAPPSFLLVVLAFFMPWYAVSCQGVPLAQASGWDIATHGFRNVDSPRPSMGGLGGSSGTSDAMFGSPATSRRSNRDVESRSKSTIWIVAVPVLALIGAALALMGLGSKAGSRRLRFLAASCGMAIIALMFVHQMLLKSDLRTEMAGGGGGGGDQLGSAMAGALAGITIDLRGGWILAFLGAMLGLIGAGMGAIAVGKDLAKAHLAAPAGGMPGVAQQQPGFGQPPAGPGGYGSPPGAPPGG